MSGGTTSRVPARGRADDRSHAASTRIGAGDRDDKPSIADAANPDTWLVPPSEPSVVCTSIQCSHEPKRKCTRCGRFECPFTLNGDGVCIVCGIPKPLADTVNNLRTPFERGLAWGALELLPAVPR